MSESTWMMLTIAPLLILVFPCRSAVARALVVLAFALATGVYLHWRWVNWRYGCSSAMGLAYQATFLTFELLGLGYDLFSSAYLIWRTDRRGEAAELAARLAHENVKPTVDVFVPSRTEPAAIVVESVRAACAMDWPRDRLRVVLLDDGKTEGLDEADTRIMMQRRRELEAACAGLGAVYLRRPDSEGGKGGNLNYGYTRTSGDYIAVLDADFQAQPELLREIIGFLLYDPGTAIIQTPQTFRNPCPIAMNLGAPWAVPENQNAFMNVIQPARDAQDAAFCVGSGFAVKRSLIDRLGGFPSDTVAEDLGLTLAALALGFKTRFLAKKLAHGLAPQSIGEYTGQQARWAAGSMQHLWHRFGPLRNPGLTFVQRLMFLEMMVYWLTFVTLALMLLAPAAYWLTGVPAVPNRHGSGMEIMGVRWLLREIVGHALTAGRVAPGFVLVGKIVPCLPVAAVTMLSLLVPGRKWHYRVTAKFSESRAHASVCWPVVGPLVALASVIVLGLASNWSGAVSVVPRADIVAGNLVWTWCSLFVLALAILAGVDQPWDPRDDHPDKEAQRFDVGPAALALARRLLG